MDGRQNTVAQLELPSARLRSSAETTSRKNEVQRAEHVYIYCSQIFGISPDLCTVHGHQNPLRTFRCEYGRVRQSVPREPDVSAEWSPLDPRAPDAPLLMFDNKSSPKCAIAKQTPSYEL